MTPQDWQALWLTLRLALISTVILFLLGAPLAWWLAHTRRRWATLVESLVALPLVLPPTVLGFYLLIAMGPAGPIGQLSNALGLPPLVFSFYGLVLGSVFYSLPFVVQPLHAAFASLGRRPLEVAATLGATPWQRCVRVIVPLTRPGWLTAIVLGFAHTVGEFGVVLMIGGNIPGETQVLSIAIYEHVETLEYTNAHILSGMLLIFSFLTLVLVYSLNRRFRITLI